MSDNRKKRSWALMVSPEYRKESKRLAPKFLNQIARKTQDLMNDPTPGGSRTPLKHYPGLCRLRAGEFRIIYVYNDTVVELLTLRRRDETTYDDLDHLEIQQLEPFRRISDTAAPVRYDRDWAEVSKNYEAPTHRSREPLPQPITREMLDGLSIPKHHWDLLMQLTTTEDLLGCGSIPSAILEQVLECVSPREIGAIAGAPLPVVVREDLINNAAAIVSGPIDTADSLDAERGATTMEIPLARGGVPAPLVLFQTRRNEQMSAYHGNTSKATGNDAKYTVKLRDGTVQLTYTISSAESVLLTIDGHDDLVGLVNEAKRLGGATQGGGGFLINEYRHVLVPTLSGAVLFAGVYTRDLEFTFGDALISPVARSGIQRGDVWPGPHVGVKYTLAAGASDIRFESETEGGVRRKVLLSEFSTPKQMAELLRMCREVKPEGGALYINEARELFAPVKHGEGFERLYIGHLGTMPWFPEPA